MSLHLFLNGSEVPGQRIRKPMGMILNVEKQHPYRHVDPKSFLCHNFEFPKFIGKALIMTITCTENELSLHLFLNGSEVSGQGIGNPMGMSFNVEKNTYRHVDPQRAFYAIISNFQNLSERS